MKSKSLSKALKMVKKAEAIVFKHLASNGMSLDDISPSELEKAVLDAMEELVSEKVR